MPGFIINTVGGHRKAAPSTAEYYYSYFWDIKEIFQGIIPGPIHDTIVHAESASLPTFTVDKEIVQGGSLNYKYAKNATWEDIKITWYDTKGFIDVVKKWRSMVWTEEDGIKQANEYKRDTTLSVYLPTGKTEVDWALYNSWPSVIRHGELTYVSSNAKIVEVTITYDWAEENSGAAQERAAIT
jgi:hypothetical protein